MITKFITQNSHFKIPSPQLLKETIFLNVIQSAITMKQFILKQFTPLFLSPLCETHAQELQIVFVHVVKAYRYIGLSGINQLPGES